MNNKKRLRIWIELFHELHGNEDHEDLILDQIIKEAKEGAFD